LSTWLLAAVPRNTHSAVLDKAQIPRIIDELIAFASNSATHAITQSCLLQLALYVNKHIETADLGHIDDLLSRKFLALRDEPMGETTSFEFNLRLIFTLVKALVLRLSPKTNQYLTGLVDLLDENQYPREVSRKAAMGFATILSSDDVLSKKNGAQIRLLAPQRVFQMLTPLISDKFKASRSASEKENYLVAISGILGSVPSEIVMPELPTLLPLLLQSLDVTDQMVKIATLETLAVVISNNPSALEESGHIPALVKRLIMVATVPKSKSPKHVSTEQNVPTPNLPTTRRLAARCLALLPKYVGTATSKVNPLLALKREVLHGLTGVLDDPKRDVRKEAVDARAAWLRGVDDINDDDV
jgi:DNA repair/transcription protein MET18/MMS19